MQVLALPNQMQQTLRETEAAVFGGPINEDSPLD